MKITKKRLQRIIKEETEAVIKEGMFSKVKAKMGWGPEIIERAFKRAWKAIETAKKSGTRAEGGEKVSAAELSADYSALDYILREITSRRAKLGMSSTQESMWKGIKEEAFMPIDKIQMEIKFAIEREEGEEAAEQAELDMRRRHVEWQKADEARKKAKEAAKPFVPSEEYTRTMTNFSGRDR